MDPALVRSRARDWLRLHAIEHRHALLLSHDDLAIVEMAEEDGVFLICLSDIQRERDLAVQRLPEIAA